jgi:hypothetical protein
MKDADRPEGPEGPDRPEGPEAFEEDERTGLPRHPRWESLGVWRLGNVLWQALWQAYARAVLFLSSRGVRLPGADGARLRVSAQTVSAYERRALVYGLKASRYHYAHGPIWVRATVDAVASLWQKNRFWAALISKGVFGAVFVSLPLFAFVLLRGVLPVPERVPERYPALALPARTSLRVDRPFTSDSTLAPFAHLFSSEDTVRGVAVRDDSGVPLRAPENGATASLARSAPRGYIFSVGALPRRMEYVQGHLASESVPVEFTAGAPVRVAIEGRNRLRASWFAFPTASREGITCRFELLDATGRALTSTEFAPPPAPGALASRLSVVFQSRFTPDFAYEPLSWNEAFVDTDRLPQRLVARVTRVMPNAPSIGAEDLSVSPPHDCLVLVGQPSFEWQRVHPYSRRGAVVAVVEGLRPEDALDAENAPFLASLARKDAFNFTQHRVSTNDAESNTRALLSGMESSQRAEGATSLPNALRAAGYRTGAFGRLPRRGLSANGESFDAHSEAPWIDGFDDVVSLEAREYEARHVTEELSAWLERYGEAPFFALAQYATLQPPFRPPFSRLSLGSLLSSPLGVERERTLRRAVLRYVDAELSTLASRLRALGVWKEVDFVVTSNGALPLVPLALRDAEVFPPDLPGALRSHGASLSDDEIRVPLVWKAARQEEGESYRVDRASFAPDVAVTLASLHGVAGSSHAPLASSMALDVSHAMASRSLLELNSTLGDRRIARLVGASAIGIMVFPARAQDAAFKFVDRLVPRVSENDPPGGRSRVAREREPGERYFSVSQGGLGAEVDVPGPPRALVRALRERLRAAHFPHGLPLRFVFAKEGPVDLSVVVEREAGARVLELPVGLTGTWDALGEGLWRLRLEGRARPGDRARVVVQPRDVVRFEIAPGRAFTTCLGALRIDGGGAAALVRDQHPCLWPPEAFDDWTERGNPMRPDDVAMAFERAPPREELGRDGQLAKGGGGR